jgi:restriction system protein
MIQKSDNIPNPHVPHFPTYEETCCFVNVIDMQSKKTFYAMRDAINSSVGTPQETLDWTQPEEWIPRVLHGESQKLALHIWKASNNIVNPRHLTGVWLLASSYNLVEDSKDIFHTTELGHDFVHNPFGETVKHIDYREGLANLLLIVSEHGPGKRSDFLPHYTDFLERYSNYRSQRSFNMAWYGRIRNLNQRELVGRSGVNYEITKNGLAYLENVGDVLQQMGRETATKPQTEIRRLIKIQQDEVRNRLQDTLFDVNPYYLEHIVKGLLESMNYENVEVTNRSGDGGVDVIADIQVGITTVREVVQVKRHRRNIQRRVLDELRGSLHRFDATRGTIITTSRFSSGAQEAAFERGAAPITLIDGERLIDLLIEHEIGVRKRLVQLIEFEPADFAEEETEE